MSKRKKRGNALRRSPRTARSITSWSVKNNIGARSDRSSVMAFTSVEICRTRKTVAQRATMQDAVYYAYDDLSTYPLLGLPAGALVAGLLSYVRGRAPLSAAART